MSLNQLTAPLKPLNVHLGNVFADGELVCNVFKDERNVCLVGVSDTLAGITASSNFITGFTVNTLQKYTNASGYVIREVYLTFSTPLASGQVFSFDFQQQQGESIVFTSAQLLRGASINPVYGTSGVGAEPNTVKIQFDYLVSQPATSGEAIMNCHLIFVKNA